MRLLQRREVWVLTLPGWMLVFALMFAVSSFLVSQIYPFLAITQPIAAKILVVDGWLPDYAIARAQTEFQRGHYQKILALGGPLPKGTFLSDYKTYAELGAASLQAIGMASSQIVALPVPYTQRDRTLTAAKTLKEWLMRQTPPMQAVNLYTLGPHARRSWLLASRVLSPQIQSGIIAALPDEYPAQNWWQYSEGVRSVLSELLGLIYAVIRIEN